MAGFDFTLDEEAKIYNELDAYEKRRESFRASASPELAMTIADFYRSNPDTSPGLILAAAKAKQAGQLTGEQFSRISLDVIKREAQEATQRKERSWWDRNVYDKLKTGSRWTMAGLNFIPQFVQGGIGQIFDDNDSVAGWFISTDLGTLIENDEVAGEGFFIGGRAAKMQAERARRYRGEIDGKAFTIGRGIASTFVQPGSSQYNTLSGLIDAAAAIFTPSAPGAKSVAGFTRAGLGEAGVTRSLAGLTFFESPYIERAKVSNWLNGTVGTKLVNRIAETNNIEDMLDLFPRVIDTSLIVKMTEESNPTQIRNILDDVLGTRPGVASIDDINISRVDDMRRLIGRSHTMGKLMAKVPGRHLVMVGGNMRDVNDSIRNMDAYFKLLKGVTKKKRNDIVMGYAKALLNADGDVFATGDAFYKVLSESLIANGVPVEAIDDMTAGITKFGNKDVYGVVDSDMSPTSFGAKIQLPDGTITDKKSAMAMLQSEAINQAGFILPDPRRVRRMMSDLGWVTGRRGKLSDPSKYGDLRFPITAVEFWQNELWRPVTLATGGYSLRNLTEASFMYSFAPGVRGGVFHPVHWIQTAMYKRYRGDIRGQRFDEIADMDAEDILTSGSEEFMEATNQRMRETMDKNMLEAKGYTDRVYRPVKRDSDPNQNMFTEGVQTAIYLLRKDPLTRKLAAGESPADVAKWLKETPEGRKYLDGVVGREKNQYMFDQNGNANVVTPWYYRTVEDGFEFNDFNIDEHVKMLARRVERQTGSNQILKEMISEGTTEIDGKQVQVFRYNSRGDIIGYNPEFKQAVRSVVDDGVTRLETFYKIGEEVRNAAIRGGSARGAFFQKADALVDHLFASIYPKREAFLARSPLFRQAYYNQVGRLIDELTVEGAYKLDNQLAEAAARAKVQYLSKNDKIAFLGKYVGDANIAKKILAKIDNPKAATGKLSLEEVDSFAKGIALDDVKKRLFDASDKSNFADILRIVAPFGSAWADVVTRWSKLLSSEPEALKRMGMSVQGFRNADPDADGKGFFWKDPVTGEYMFNYPFNKQIGPLASYLGGFGALTGGVFGGAKGAVVGGVASAAAGFGIEKGLGLSVPGTTLVAPAKSLNMSLNIIPGLGPFAQISASKILGNMPQADTVMKIITPYGEPDITSVGPIPVPSWGQKIISALSDPENNRLLGDMTIETMRVLSMTGDYDLSKPADVQRLEEDSVDRARILIMLRGIGQFVGPSRPEPEFKVDTYQGDKYTAELSKAFRDMQTQNYDTAVERFLNAFGEDALLYVSGKTRALTGGLEATEQFGDFERDNADLFAQFGDVAGYFAPVGGNFDYAVYLRQLNTGKRERLKPSELVEEAQAIIGRSLYRSTVQAIGPNPNSDQQEYLRDVRSLIAERFPGFATAPIDINQAKARLLQIEQAAFSGLLDGNPVAEPTRIFLEQRQLALQEAERRGYTTLSGKNVSDLRTWLRDIGTTLLRQYPEFERIYDRVLFPEIDLDAGGTL